MIQRAGIALSNFQLRPALYLIAICEQKWLGIVVT
jgi:hypothetical protein